MRSTRHWRDLIEIPILTTSIFWTALIVHGTETSSNNRIRNYSVVNGDLITKAWKNQVLLNGKVHEWNNQNDAIRVFQEWVSLLKIAEDEGSEARRRVGLDFEKYVVTQNILPLGKIGTTVPGYAEGDFDMTLLGSTSLLELFKDDRLLLTDKTMVHLIKKLSQLWGQDSKNNFEVLFLTIAETENHLFMSESSRYLINQMIFENRRKLPALRALRDSLSNAGVELDNRNGNLKSLLLKSMQQVMQNGFFEFNAQIYQRFTIHALDNLYSFASDSTIKNGSACLLDYLATIFAFQSYDGIRYGPYRRSAEVYQDSSLIGRDAACSFFTAQSRRIEFADFSNHEVWNKQMGHADMVLFSTVLKYRIPAPIIAFMQERPDRYRAEIHSAYAGIGARNRPTEIYTGGKNFLATAGGRTEKYLGPNFPCNGFWFQSAPWIYDVITRSSSIILNPAIEHPSSSSDILHFKGEQWRANNMAVYGSFVYGYSPTSAVGESGWPQNIPRHWGYKNLNYSGEQKKGNDITKPGLSDSIFSTRDFDFRFLDRSQSGVYVILSRLRPDRALFAWTAPKITRGSIEIVDTSSIGTLHQLREQTLAKNRTQGIRSVLRHAFVYVTFDGTQIFLNSRYDAKREGFFRVLPQKSASPVLPITLPFEFPCGMEGVAGLSSSRRSNELRYSAFSLMDTPKPQPLFSVEVQSPWKGTVSISDGEGNMYVYHPGIGEYLVSNFKEWWNPIRKIGSVYQLKKVSKD